MVVMGGPGKGFSNAHTITQHQYVEVCCQKSKKMVLVAHNVKSDSCEISMGKGGLIVKYILVFFVIFLQYHHANKSNDATALLQTVKKALMGHTEASANDKNGGETPAPERHWQHE